jgi:hypothetical protein
MALFAIDIHPLAARAWFAVWRASAPTIIIALGRNKLIFLNLS